MQEEITTSLKMTIAKLELKQLEVIDKLSEKHNDSIIRCITCPESDEFLAVNGDWEHVTGFKEDICIGMNFNDFIPDYTASEPKEHEDGFEWYNSQLITKTGESVNVDWKMKHFPDINAIVSIGRVTK